MTSPVPVGRTDLKQGPNDVSTDRPASAPNRAGRAASGADRARVPGSPSAVLPAGGEIRTKQWAGRTRRYYSEVLCSAVNHPADPLHFPALRRELRRGRKPPQVDVSLRVLDDPDYPATHVARAITEVVRGEEDKDWEVYEAGARYLLLMLSTYPIVVESGLHRGYPTSSASAPDGRALGGDPGSRSQPQRFPIVRFDFEDTHWVRLNLALAVSRDAPSNSSAWLLQEFVRYELFYKGRLLRLGVCHNPMCERLYVKAKHAGSTQSFCNRACGDAARRQRQAL